MSVERPRFRRDLVPAIHDVDGIRVVDVIDPRRNTSFRFYDYEYSVALAFDGRPLAKVIPWVRITAGLELTMEQLSAFAQELEGLGFLEAEAAPPAPQAHKAVAYLPIPEFVDVPLSDLTPPPAAPEPAAPPAAPKPAAEPTRADRRTPAAPMPVVSPEVTQPSHRRITPTYSMQAVDRPVAPARNKPRGKVETLRTGLFWAGRREAKQDTDKAAPEKTPPLMASPALQPQPPAATIPVCGATPGQAEHAPTGAGLPPRQPFVLSPSLPASVEMGEGALPQALGSSEDSFTSSLESWAARFPGPPAPAESEPAWPAMDEPTGHGTNPEAVQAREAEAEVEAPAWGVEPRTLMEGNTLPMGEAAPAHGETGGQQGLVSEERVAAPSTDGPSGEQPQADAFLASAAEEGAGDAVEVFRTKAAEWSGPSEPESSQRTFFELTPAPVLEPVASDASSEDEAANAAGASPSPDEPPFEWDPAERIAAVDQAPAPADTAETAAAVRVTEKMPAAEETVASTAATAAPAEVSAPSVEAPAAEVPAPVLPPLAEEWAPTDVAGAVEEEIGAPTPEEAVHVPVEERFADPDVDEGAPSVETGAPVDEAETRVLTAGIPGESLSDSIEDPAFTSVPAQDVAATTAAENAAPGPAEQAAATRPCWVRDPAQSDARPEEPSVDVRVVQETASSEAGEVEPAVGVAEAQPEPAGSEDGADVQSALAEVSAGADAGAEPAASAMETQLASAGSAAAGAEMGGDDGTGPAEAPPAPLSESVLSEPDAAVVPAAAPTTAWAERGTTTEAAGGDGNETASTRAEASMPLLAPEGTAEDDWIRGGTPMGATPEPEAGEVAAAPLRSEDTGADGDESAPAATDVAALGEREKAGGEDAVAGPAGTAEAGEVAAAPLRSEDTGADGDESAPAATDVAALGEPEDTTPYASESVVASAASESVVASAAWAQAGSEASPLPWANALSEAGAAQAQAADSEKPAPAPAEAYEAEDTLPQLSPGEGEGASPVSPAPVTHAEAASPVLQGETTRAEELSRAPTDRPAHEWPASSEVAGSGSGEEASPSESRAAVESVDGESARAASPEVAGSGSEEEASPSEPRAAVESVDGESARAASPEVAGSESAEASPSAGSVSTAVTDGEPVQSPTGVPVVAEGDFREATSSTESPVPVGEATSSTESPGPVGEATSSTESPVPVGEATSSTESPVPVGEATSSTESPVPVGEATSSTESPVPMGEATSSTASPVPMEATRGESDETVPYAGPTEAAALVGGTRDLSSGERPAPAGSGTAPPEEFSDLPVPVERPRTDAPLTASPSHVVAATSALSTSDERPKELVAFLEGAAREHAPAAPVVTDPSAALETHRLSRRSVYRPTPTPLRAAPLHTPAVALRVPAGRRWALLGYAALGVACAGLLGVLVSPLILGGRQPEGIKVRTFVPAVGSVYRWFDATAPVERAEAETLTFPVGGKVIRVVELGAAVAAGDVLATVEATRPMQLELARRQERQSFYRELAERARAAGNVEQARHAQAKLEEQSGFVRQMLAAIARVAVVAQAPGRVEAVVAVVGQSVRPGAPAVRVRPAGWRARFELSRAQAAQARHVGFCRLEVEGQLLGCTLHADPADDLHVQAELDEIDPHLAGKPARLARLRYESAFVLPSGALSRVGSADRVWVALPSSRVESRAVLVAEQGAGGAIVTQGLDPGEVVVIDPPAGLSAGALIRSTRVGLP